MSRTLLRSVLELRTPMTRLPPSFLLPMRKPTARTLSTTSAKEPTEASSTAATSITPAKDATPSPKSPRPPPQKKTTSKPPPFKPISTPPSPSVTAAATALLYPKEPQAPVPTTPESQAQLAQFLPLLRGQPGGHHITVHIWGRPYLVTAGDQIRLPFRMPGVLPGDVLRLDRVSALGSRDFTLKGRPYVDERLFVCRAVVTGTESEPLRKKVKKKPRTRRSQTVTSKHRYTILRISEVTVKGPEVVGL